MEIEIFTLCKAATIDSNGSLNILGSFDIISSIQTPIIYPTCTLAVKLRFDKIEEGNKTLRISFIDDDGKPVLPSLEQAFKVSVPPSISTSSVSLPLLIQKLKLESFGDYSINIAIDGDLKGQIPLYVRQIHQ